MCISAFFQIRASRGSRAFHCLQSRYTGRKRREGGRSSTSLSSEEEGRSRVVFVTGKLRLSGLEETFIEGISVSTPFGDIFIGGVRVVERVRGKTGVANGVELNELVFLLFLGVSGRGISDIVVVSKAACTWVYTLEKSLGFRQAAA